MRLTDEAGKAVFLVGAKLMENKEGRCIFAFALALPGGFSGKNSTVGAPYYFIMKKHCLSVLVLALFSFQAFAQKLPRPKVVVGIVVDQMRWDYLYRYYDRYGGGGFKRLMNEGFNCQQTFINYLPSYTAPGHASAYTGSFPAIHGIAGNDWVENATGRRWYCTEDTTVQGTEHAGKAGKMSPRNLLTTTITDELRLATNMQSRVFAVALKDRGAILPGGHLANGAFWFDDARGKFITSTYYMQSAPEWLNRFNDRKVPDSLLQLNWNLLYEPVTYTQSLPDENPYEGRYKGAQNVSFPHQTSQYAGSNYGVIRSLPAGNVLTLAMARACMEAERIGMGAATDFMCISFSSTDYIGHQFAPNSVEIEDTYLRLDQELAAFFTYLDNRYGKENYLLFLTADHGGAHNANYLKDINIPAGMGSDVQMKNDLNALFKGRAGISDPVLFLDNYQIFLNEKQLTGKPELRTQVKKEIMSWLRRQTSIAWVADLESGDLNMIPEPVKTMIINGYHPERSGAVMFVPKPGWYNGYAPTGTTHGTWNPYDTRIPLLWYGWGIKKGQTNKRVYMTDIAATLAALLHIQMPNGCVGEPVAELVD